MMWHRLLWVGVIAVLLSTKARVEAGEVSIKPLRGEVVRAELVALSEQEVIVRLAAGDMKWAAQEILSVSSSSDSFRLRTDDRTAPITVGTSDASELLGLKFSIHDSEVDLLAANGSRLTFSSRLLRWVKFTAQDAATKAQWEVIAASVGANDVLVIRKPTPPTADAGSPAVTLDQLEGVVLGVSEEAVAFQFDGDKINVPRAKVEGIFLKRPASADVGEPRCRLTDSHGSVWNLRTVTWRGGMLAFETLSGIAGEIPLSSLNVLDYSASSLVYLSDLEPESFEWRPYLASTATTSTLAKWFAMKRDHAGDGTTLVLGGEPLDKGLAFHSRAEVSYRLTKSFLRFQAIAGIDERMRGQGKVRLVVSGDGKKLLEREVRGGDAPFELDVNIDGVRRLSLLVDFGSDRSDVGDHLLLGNARLTK